MLQQTATMGEGRERRDEKKAVEKEKKRKGEKDERKRGGKKGESPLWNARPTPVSRMPYRCFVKFILVVIAQCTSEIDMAMRQHWKGGLNIRS